MPQSGVLLIGLKERFGHPVSKYLSQGIGQHGLYMASSVISAIHTIRRVQIKPAKSTLCAAVTSLNYSMRHTPEGQGVVTGCVTASVSAMRQRQTALTLEFTSQSS